MICAHLLTHIFIKFEQYNNKIQRNVYCMCNRDIHKPFMIKERKRKSREHIKKREKIGNKRGGRKIKEKKRKIKQGKKESFE